jgi:SAM-dependent methyltransferase
MRDSFRALRFRRLIRNVYNKRFLKYGCQPHGVFWSDSGRQKSRFKIIKDQMSALVPSGIVKIADIGCGYGSLADYMRETPNSSRFVYTGYDINPTLIAACHQYSHLPSKSFAIGDCPMELVDFSVMSGTYNMAVTKDLIHWERYMFRCLAKCWDQSRIGMIFNVLVADKSHISDGMLYHCEVDKLRRRCIKQFGTTRIIRERSLPRDATLVVTRRRFSG